MPAIGPVSHPAEGTKPAVPPVLTAEQQQKYDELLTAVKAWSTLPKTSSKGAEEEALSDDERMWLTRECLLRYLRATKWNLPQATQRLRDTVVWRREYGTDRFTADYISEENATGMLLPPTITRKSLLKMNRQTSHTRLRQRGQTVPISPPKQAEYEEQSETGGTSRLHAGTNTGHYAPRARDIGALDRFPKQQRR